MKLAIFIVILGLAFSLKLRTKQETQEVFSHESCLKMSNNNVTACDEVHDCQTNSQDCDMLLWSELQEDTAVCYRVEHPEWSGAEADMTVSEDVVACLWKGFCEQILGQTPNWCVKRWAQRHEAAEQVYESEIVLAKSKSMAKSKGPVIAAIEFALAIFEIIAAF